MSEFFLSFSAGTIDLDEDKYPDDLSQARLIGVLLSDGEDWVQLHARYVPGHYTQWTVLERDERGIPLNIIVRLFDGDMEVINNTPDNAG